MAEGSLGSGIKFSILKNLVRIGTITEFSCEGDSLVMKLLGMWYQDRLV